MTDDGYNRDKQSRYLPEPLDVWEEPPPPKVLTDSERQAAMSYKIRSLTAKGWRLESKHEFQAVMAYGTPINHVLHAIITLGTCGFWAIAWVIFAAKNSEKRLELFVDEAGFVAENRIQSS